MPANSTEYQRLYMQNYTKTKGAVLYSCPCGKEVKRCDKTRHNKTHYHIKNADKEEPEKKASDIETLRKEIEELRKQLVK
jgi:predicted RNA-binding Zn-ribbon protein involved in translation (DUF1610 family)